MKSNIVLILLGLGTLAAGAAEGGSPPVYEPIYREGQDPWKYFGGDEFPGAQGRLGTDRRIFKNGSRALRLDADFSGGGAYVSALRNLDQADPVGLALWVRGENLSHFAVRFTDSSGQTHQRKGIPLKEGEWSLVRLDLAEIVGGEHWGGAADGKWHGPAKSITLLISAPALMRPARNAATLWLDEVALQVAADRR